MRDLTIQKLQEIIGGRLRLAALEPRDGARTRVGSIVIDSRQARAENVFWGLPGTRFDGVQFASEAYRRGARGVIAGGYVQPWPGCWSLEVEHPEEALRELARWNRNRLEGTVIGVTGSVGKTTTREMIAAGLSSRLTGSSSPRNYNNHVGLPLSMMAIEPEHDFAVLELAASGRGEIAALASLARPTIGVITRVGEAHRAGFGGEHGIATAKTELFKALPRDGWAVLSGDDPWLRRLGSECHANVIWVGRSLDCDIVATNIQSCGGTLSFSVAGQRVRIPVWGRHHVNSALAAIAVGQIMGLSLRDVIRGLADFQPPPMRCQVQEAQGATIINDAYNSSPTAMRAALELLRDFDAPGKRIVVCGDMRELGDAAEAMHRGLGDEVVTLCGADLLLACGEHAEEVVEGAVRAGMPRARVMAYHEPEETLPRLHSALEPGDVVLIKGSRALAMERLAEHLQTGRPRMAA